MTISAQDRRQTWYERADKGLFHFAFWIGAVRIGLFMAVLWLAILVMFGSHIDWPTYFSLAFLGFPVMGFFIGLFSWMIARGLRRSV